MEPQELGILKGLVHETKAHAKACHKPLANGEAGRRITMGKGTGEEAVFPEHMKLLLVCVNKTHEPICIYNRARYSWEIIPAKAGEAEYVLAVEWRVIIGVFKAEKWFPALSIHFPQLPPEHANWEEQKGRFGFIGIPASNDVKHLYLGKSVPKKWRFRGAPVRYVNF